MLLSPANDTHKEECFNRNRHPDSTYLHLALCSLGCFCWFGFKLYHVWMVELYTMSGAGAGRGKRLGRKWAAIALDTTHTGQDPKSFPWPMRAYTSGPVTSRRPSPITASSSLSTHSPTLAHLLGATMVFSLVPFGSLLRCHLLSESSLNSLFKLVLLSTAPSPLLSAYQLLLYFSPWWDLLPSNTVHVFFFIYCLPPFSREKAPPRQGLLSGFSLFHPSRPIPGSSAKLSSLVAP